MSDFEDRLRDALGSGADDAPDVHGLAAAARSRARARRRTTAGVVVAVAIAAIAVPLGAFALRDSGPDHSDVPVVDASNSSVPETSNMPSVPDGWRTETWHDLEIRVPADWAYGALSTWCISHDEPGEPFVQRPEGAVEAIACTPSSGYGVSFIDASTAGLIQQPGAVKQVTGPSDDYPDGAWAGYEISRSGAAVLVVTRTRALARQILESARTVDGVDSNGCAPQATSMVTHDDADTMSVCRYGADGWLEQSELLSGQPAVDAIAALEAAPERFYAPPCAGELGGDQPQTEYAVLIASDASYTVQWTGSTCPYHGVFVGDDIRRKLTPEVMYWALSPGWSGGVDGDVPLPERLRSR